jgi:hypothetical protein
MLRRSEQELAPLRRLPLYQAVRLCRAVVEGRDSPEQAPQPRSFEQDLDN